MLYDDNLLRTTLRDFRMKYGREATHIFVPISFLKGYYNHVSQYLSPCYDNMTMYGVKVVTWDRDEIKCQEYIKPEVTWVS